MGYPRFGVLLARLSAHRQLGSDGLSRLAEVSEPELLRVFEGAEPHPSLLLRLAPVLGWHDVDLFVLAGMPAPGGLAPLDAEARSETTLLVNQASRLRPEHNDRLRRFAQALPQQERTLPFPPPKSYERYEPSLGAALIRMMVNRNLNWTSTAKVLYCLTGLGLSSVTIGQIGRGRKELSPDLIARLATVLGIPAGDLAAVTGIDLPEQPPQAHPAAAELAGLIWDVRRLTAGQVQQVREEAEALQQERLKY